MLCLSATMDVGTLRVVCRLGPFPLAARADRFFVRLPIGQMPVYLHFLHQSIREAECQLLTVEDGLRLMDYAVVRWREDDDV